MHGGSPSRPAYVTADSLTKFITSALQEDVGDGDHSSLASVPESLNAKARLLIKDDGILAGVDLAIEIFTHFDKRLRVELLKSDGDIVRKNEIAFFVDGPARSILTTERLVLNCMQRMSGIATRTHHLCQLIEGTGATLIDTRKTTPHFRMPEKWAVVIGGGTNHRFGLFDMIMLKDNHIDMAGGISKAIELAYQYRENYPSLKIEVETRTLEEVREVTRTGHVDVVMLDNMSVSDMKKALTIIGGQYKTEASGGITESNIRDIAECGVDFISVGALTHSFKSLDLSLKVIG